MRSNCFAILSGLGGSESTTAVCVRADYSADAQRASQAPHSPRRAPLKSLHSPAAQSDYPLQHTSTTQITQYTHPSSPRQDSSTWRLQAHTALTAPQAQQFIYGLLHERRIRHCSRRDRAEQDRRQRLPWNCRRSVENGEQLRQLGLATGGWPTVKGGRKVRRDGD